MGVSAAIVGSAAIGAYSSDKAADAQAKGARDAARAAERSTDKQIAFDREVYEQQRADNKPWLDSGKEYLSTIREGIKRGDFKPEEFRFSFNQSDPSYQFRFNEGLKAVNNQLQARGMNISGTQYKNLMRYGQEMGSQEYGNEFNRDMQTYQANRAANMDEFNIMANMAGMGQTASQSNVAAAGQMGINYAYAQQNLASAQGSAYQNAANATAMGYGNQAGAINQGVQNYLTYKAMA